jgi:penicillin-binding protein 1C
MKRRRLVSSLKWGGLVSSTVVALFLVWVVAVEFPAEKLQREGFTSTLVVDRGGRPLREVLGVGDRRARWLERGEIADDVALATIHAEDKRFLEHDGVDPVAVTRSVWYNLRRQRLVTGASTLTQQTVKLVMPRGRRDVVAKAMEAVWALRLERSLSKDEILEQYLNRAPYGHQRFGIEAAARLYFGKSASRLSLAEATLLAGLPQAPTANDPYRNMPRARKRQLLLLGQMRDRGAISQSAYDRAVAETIRLQPKDGVLRAPHFSQRALDTCPTQELSKSCIAEVRTTLDLELQTQVEGIVRTQLQQLRDKNVSQAAVVVLDNRTGKVLSWVGSDDYFDADRLGANDGVTARRQPGSTLKPLVYALYFERGGTPADLIADLPTEFPTQEGVYVPRNFSRSYRGPISVRDALGNSLNVPVVAVAAELGPKAILDRLHELNFHTLDQEPDHYGLGIALGDGDARLLDLAAAYAALAREGEYIEPNWIEGTVPRRRQVMSPEASYQILDILADDDARALSFGRAGVLALPYRVAIKTGTSTHFRDAWTVGTTPDFTVAVWMGNFDGAPMHRISGSRGPAPVLRHVFQALYPEAAGPGDVAWFKRPSGVKEHQICAFSGQPAGPQCSHRRRDVFAHGRKGASGPMGHDGHHVEGPDTCQMHVALPIDKRNGHRATAGCDPAFVETVVFHNVPAAWQEWALEQGLEPPPHAWSQLCGPGLNADATEERPYIAHPLDGDQFLLTGSPHANARSMPLRALYKGAEKLTWYVDGKSIGTADRPFMLRWKMTRGRHTIGVGRDGIEASVRIDVR